MNYRPNKLLTLFLLVSLVISGCTGSPQSIKDTGEDDASTEDLNSELNEFDDFESELDSLDDLDLDELNF